MMQPGAASADSAIAVLASGGLDSCVLMGHLLRRGRHVQPLYVRCGLVWEAAELAALSGLLQRIATSELRPLVVLDLPIRDLYGKHWSINGLESPDADTPDDAVYLPGRNALLVVKPAVWCAMHGIGELALALLAGNPFADATDDFFVDLESMLTRGMGGPMRVLRPFARLRKQDVIQLGRELPLELTFSCIAPVGELSCGCCNKCHERQVAFRAAGIADPTRYANSVASPLPLGES